MQNSNSKRTYGGLIFSGLLMGLLVTGCGRGPQGPKGPAGAPGQVGDLNQSGGIMATMSCDGTTYGTNSVLDGLFVTYDAVLTRAGDVYATASISDKDFQVSSTSFFAEGQNGSSNAAVMLVNDMYLNNNRGYWRISLNRETLVTTAIYNDPDLTAPVVITFDADACAAQNW